MAVCSHTRRHCATSGPGRVRRAAVGRPALRLPPRALVLVEQRGDRVADPRRELARRLVGDRVAAARRSGRSAGAGPGSASLGRAASLRTCPRCAIGTTGTWCTAARKAAPYRNRPIQPSGERVPSGKITRLQPSASTSPGVVAIEPAAALDRERVEDDRRADRAPPGVEEVVGRRRDRRASPPRARATTTGSAGCRGGEAWLATKITGPSSRVQHVEALHVGADLRTEQRLQADPSAPPRGPIIAGRRRAQSVGKTVLWRAGTNGSAERGTWERRPHRHPRAVRRTSSMPSRSQLTRCPRDRARPRCRCGGLCR